MTLHVIYEPSAGATTDLATTDHVRLPSVDVTINAEEGSAAHSMLSVEDMGGALDIVGLKRIWLWESAESAGNQVLGTFYIADREIGREVGEFDPQLVSADRWWKVNLVDHNVVLSHRVITGPDGERPAETDIARITWLRNSNYLAGVNDTLGYINTSGAVSLDKSDLRGQKAYDVLSECANHSNKNFHLIPNSPTTTAGAASYSLWYDFDYSANYRSTLRLTNVRADVDNTTTFAVDPDMVLRRTPERVYSGVLVRYNGGETYIQDTGTGNAFAYRDAVHHAVNLQTLAAATVRGNRYLADADMEEDRITLRFVVPKERVNDLREGQACEGKFSHLPEYEDWSWLRCLTLTKRQLSDEFYELRGEFVAAPAASGLLTTTAGNLMRPSRDISDYLGAGVYALHWGANGDEPDSGDDGNAVPFVGLAEPIGVSNDWTGIRALGTGLLTIELVLSALKTDVGPFTITFRILVNSVSSATAIHTTAAGLDNHTFDNTSSPLLLTVPVTNGDVITARAENSLGEEFSALPQGVGSDQHELRVTGSLLA